MTEFPTFTEFFGALNPGPTPGSRLTPYLWQTQAAERLYAGDPLDAITVPTGLGKTQILAAWLWAFARQRHEIADHTRTRRTVPTRLHFLVDRRVVVDDVYDTAMRFKKAIEHVTDPTLQVVAQALEATRTPPRSLLETTSADGLVGVVALRGGLSSREGQPVQPEHTTFPFAPTIAVGTLDLVVSRLLWRGYGVSTGRRPIDAALVGADSLIVLDEAHIAAQSLHTLRTLVRHQDQLNAGDLPRLSLVVMSATLPPSRAQAAITFDPVAEAAQHPALDKQLRNRQATTIGLTWLTYPSTPGKPATVAARKQSVKDLVDAMADRVVGAQARPGKATVAFVNTVEHAHQLGATLDDRLNGTGTRVVVLHGGAPAPVTADRLRHVRPFHNNALPKDRDEAPRTVVVTTQTLEVGADLDFDHAVIECPSIDALVQRIGRVNRSGKRTGATVQVVARHGDPTPVYGTQVIEATGTIVADTPTVEALDKLVALGLPTAAVRAPEPVLTLDRPTFDDYTFTRGLSGEPDVGSWIRAKDSPYRVQVVWRDALAAIPLEEYERYAREVPARGWETWSIRPDLLAAALKIPMSAEPNEDIGVVVVRPGPAQDHIRAFTGKAEYPDLVAALTPGATVYVATPLGGLPDYRDSGLDLSGFRLPDDEPVTVVVTQNPHNALGVVTLPAGAVDDGLPESEMSDLVRDAIRQAVTSTPAAGTPLAVEAGALLADQVTHVGQAERQVVTPLVGGLVWLVTSMKAREQCVAHGDLGLSVHLQDVGNRAAAWARTLGLDHTTTQALQLAGSRHDLGKNLAELQASLRYELVGRDLVRPRGDETIRAKSTLPRWRRAEASRLARVPDGFRHEALSVALSDELDYPDGVDRALVRHLIGSHHGHGRGMFHLHQDANRSVSYQIEGRTVQARNGLQAELSNDWSTQFHDLNVTYGAYGLALLEAILRLADWSVSSENESAS